MGFGPDLFLSALFLVSALTYQTFKFKNIFLALSKSLLLAIATSLTPLSRLFHIFLHLHIDFRWAGACPAIETPINGRAIPVRGSRMSAFRFVGHLFVWIRNRRLLPKKVEKSKFWFQVWLQSWLPSSWREGDKCFWYSYIWLLTIICFICHL